MVYMQQNGTTFRTDSPQYHTQATRVSAKTGKEALRQESLADLRKYLKPGDTVYTVLRHVSRSGMLRRIDLYAMSENGPIYLSGDAANALGYPLPENGIKVGGCGMDMGFHLVYSLSRALFPDGFDCITKPDQGLKGVAVRCPSNDHSNGEKNTHHRDGGYALLHRWM